MEWLVTDKHAPPKITHKAIKLCLDSVFALAKEKGMTLVYTTTKEPSLQKRYVKYHDMTLAETEVQTFLKNLTDDEYEDLEWIIDEEQYWIREGEKSG
jgi:transposase